MNRRRAETAQAPAIGESVSSKGWSISCSGPTIGFAHPGAKRLKDASS
jgi:uncharacterized Zn-finger protein